MKENKQIEYGSGRKQDFFSHKVQQDGSGEGKASEPLQLLYYLLPGRGCQEGDVVVVRWKERGRESKRLVVKGTKRMLQLFDRFVLL